VAEKDIALPIPSVPSFAERAAIAAMKGTGSNGEVIWRSLLVAIEEQLLEVWRAKLIAHAEHVPIPIKDRNTGQTTFVRAPQGHQFVTCGCCPSPHWFLIAPAWDPLGEVKLPRVVIVRCGKCGAEERLDGTLTFPTLPSHVSTEPPDA
jgi:hypothetical protein